MDIPLTEPGSPRYIYINPGTNKVHLLMPIVSGTEIGLDNTCKSVYALQEFFSKSTNPHQITILSELNRYKEALTWDIAFIPEGMSTLKEQKEERLSQINAYIELIKKVQSHDSLKTLETAFPAYPAPLQTIMGEKETNLYSMVLAPNPDDQDTFLRSVNPVFSVHHDISDGHGHRTRKLSLLQQTLFNAYKGMTITPMDARARITAAVVSAVGEAPGFAKIQAVLGEKVQALCGADSAIYMKKGDETITQAMVDGWIPAAKTKDYIDALINYCTPTLFDTLLESPFYTIRPVGSTAKQIAQKTAESLSIATQFFLAHVNIHCRAERLSMVNFGVILDASQELSEEIAGCVISARLSNTDVEDSLLDFINAHQEDFHLARALNPEDRDSIKKQYTGNYATVKESPHFDEFMLFDATKPGKFVNHQGAICTDLCELATSIENSHFVQTQCRDFATLPRAIPPHNEGIAGSIELDIATMSDEQFAFLLERVPKETKENIVAAYPERMAKIQKRKALPDFLHCVARGQQKDAEDLLTASANAQMLLTTPASFTDYSGRTFHCTAYEYAYWAKDTHMCRMLEKYITKDEETKATMAARIDEMERMDATTGQKIGLLYQQNGSEHRSAHFDMTPLKTALQAYVNGYDAWYAANNWDAMDEAWMDVGKAQRDVPAHVAHEYCRLDRAFSPTPEFNDATLPRVLTFYNWITSRNDSWFPLTASNSGLGFDFGLIRGPWGVGLGGGGGWTGGVESTRGSVSRFDLAAITRLDEVRTADLTQSREHLNPQALSHRPGM